MAEFQKTNPANSTETTRKFVQFIMVQAQNILYVLGRIPTPEGERLPPNLQAAKMMIDQLWSFADAFELPFRPQKADLVTKKSGSRTESVVREEPPEKPQSSTPTPGDPGEDKKKFFKSYG